MSSFDRPDSAPSTREFAESSRQTTPLQTQRSHPPPAYSMAGYYQSSGSYCVTSTIQEYPQQNRSEPRYAPPQQYQPGNPAWLGGRGDPWSQTTTLRGGRVTSPTAPIQLSSYAHDHDSAHFSPMRHEPFFRSPPNPAYHSPEQSPIDPIAPFKYEPNRESKAIESSRTYFGSSVSPTAYHHEPPNPFTQTQQPERVHSYTSSSGNCSQDMAVSRQMTPPAAPKTRYHLHVRQQPSAARACGSGDKDRRDVDPPPVLQLLVTDFNPADEHDYTDLAESQFVVYCRLYTAAENEKDRVDVSVDVDSITIISEETGEEEYHPRETQRVTGRTIQHSFFVKEDPDPATAPEHPKSSNRGQSDHFARIMNKPPPSPAAFFVFNDLSIRVPGSYQLAFELMRMEDLFEPGGAAPCLAQAWTREFHVYAAKDFPGMMQSSYLMKQLKALGMSSIRLRDKGRVEKREPERERDQQLPPPPRVPVPRSATASRRIWED